MMETTNTNNSDNEVKHAITRSNSMDTICSSTSCSNAQEDNEEASSSLIANTENDKPDLFSSPPDNSARPSVVSTLMNHPQGTDEQDQSNDVGIPPPPSSATTKKVGFEDAFSFMIILSSLSLFIDNIKFYFLTKQGRRSLQETTMTCVNTVVNYIDKSMKDQSIDYEYIEYCQELLDNITDFLHLKGKRETKNVVDGTTSESSKKKTITSLGGLLRRENDNNRLKVIIDKKFVTKSDTIFGGLLLLWIGFTTMQVITHHNSSSNSHIHNHYKENFRNSMAEFTNKKEGLSHPTSRQLLETSSVGRKRKPSDNMNIPGTFLPDDSLYVLGARISTSYEVSNEDVYFDLFANGYSMESNIFSDEEEDSFSLMSYDDASKRKFYCHVEPPSLPSSPEDEADEEYWQQQDPNIDYQTLIPMKLVPLTTFDSSDIEGTERNENDILSTHTLIWRCDVSSYVPPKSYIEKAVSSPTFDWNSNDDFRNNKNKVMVHVVTTTAKENPSDLKSITDQHTKVLTVDIPISKTRSVGYGGPQIMSSTSLISPSSKHFHPYDAGTSDEATTSYDQGHGVSLCVAGITENNKKYLLEFIQHHINIGVSHIVVGVDDESNSKLMNSTKNILYDYIYKKNIVVLGGMHHMDVNGVQRLRREDGSEHNHQLLKLRKLQFYQQCLYHSKSLTEFMLILDINEMYIPPSREYFDSVVDKGENYYMFKEPHPDKKDYFTTMNDEEDVGDNDAAEAAQIYSNYDLDDGMSLIWNNMTDSEEEEVGSTPSFPTIDTLPDVIRMITGTYDTPTNNGGLGCCIDWCFQTFNSYIVLHDQEEAVLSSLSDATSSRTARSLLRKFGRNPNPDTDFIYQKYLLDEYSKRLTTETIEHRRPIINTRYAYSTSLQLGGSCRGGEKEEEEIFGHQNPTCPWILDDKRNSMTGHISFYKTLLEDDDSASTKNQRYDINLDPNQNHPITDDEYYKYFRRITLTQLKQRFLNKKNKKKQMTSSNKEFVIPDIDDNSDVKKGRWDLTSMYVP